MENHSALSRDRQYQKKTGTVVFGGLLILGLIYAATLGVENFFGGAQREGSNGSSYATIETGIKAWAELLKVNGYSVSRDRGTVDEIDNDRKGYRGQETINLTRDTTTLVVLNGALPTDELETVNSFVRQGGRLITDNPNIVEAFLGSSITVSETGSQQLRASDVFVSGMEGIDELEGSGVGSFSFDGTEEAVPLAVENNEQIISDTQFDAVVGAIRVGDGDIIVVTDTGIVSNAGLARKDNALFSLRIAGSNNSHVIFAEGVHGYDDARGFAGLPINWKVALIGLLVASVIYLSSQGRRFGVGEEPHRSLGPRRIFFAHALAQALRSSKKTSHDYPQQKEGTL